MSATVTAPDLGRWLDTLLDATPGLAILDAHTHLGEDLDGTIVHPEALLGALEPVAARAVAFALHDPAGLPAANAAVLEAAGPSRTRRASPSWCTPAAASPRWARTSSAWRAATRERRILLASDTPYGDPALNAALTLRAAHATGLDEDARRAIAGRQLERLLDGGPPADLGPAPGPDRVRRDVRLERVMTYLVAAWGSALAGGSPAQPLELARQALALPAHHALAPLAGEIRALLDLPPWGPGGLGSLSLAAMLAATPFAGPDAPAS